MEERGIHGDWKHDAMLVDVMNHDAVAHQMYTLLAPLSEDLGTDGPIATLQALIHAHQNGGSTKVAPGMAELLEQVRDKPEPVAYLKGLVERDRKFWEGIDNRSSKVDVATASMEDLRNRIKTPEAATERFRRAVDAIIAHNNVQTDPLHFWFINAREVRNLVGGKNELVQAYLETRRAEIDAHHNQYGLTPRANKKNMEIKDEVKVQ